METNKTNNIILEWLTWQFFEVPMFLLEVWKNYFVFFANLFSLPLLLKTFFSPWRRYKWVYPKGFDLMEFLNTLISNFFSRVVGALMRVVLIVVGIISQILVVIIGCFIFVGWVITPLLIISGVIFFLVY